MTEPLGELSQITAEQAIELSQAGNTLVDVREQWEWDAGHAPTALHIPMGELQDRISELADDEPILVICHSGARSLTVARALADAGHDAANVVGGMMAWRQAGGPVASDPDDTDA